MKSDNTFASESMFFCKLCVFPSTKPHMEFNKDGVCTGCLAYINRKEIDWNEMSSQDIHLDGLWTNSEMLPATNYNVLGIGSYKNHKYTFSRIEDKLEYVEDGDTYTPKWYCTYDKKDWPMKKLVADFYELLEKSIGDPPDGIIFDFNSEVVQQDEDDSKKKKVIRKLIPNYRWPLNPAEPFITIEKYVAKLKELL